MGYKRVLLKLSGEAFGAGRVGVDPDVIARIADEIAQVTRQGVQVAIVTGGGNFFRGAELQQRGMERRRADYMGMLGTVMNCLALQDFCEWMLSVMFDQVRFAKAAFRFETLNERYRRLLLDLGHDDRAASLVAAVLCFGQIERGDAHVVLKTSERTARNTMSKLVQEGFLKSNTPKGAVRIGFPLDYRERLFPNLFADTPIEAPEPPSALTRSYSLLADSRLAFAVSISAMEESLCASSPVRSS